MASRCRNPTNIANHFKREIFHPTPLRMAYQFWHLNYKQLQLILLQQIDLKHLADCPRVRVSPKPKINLLGVDLFWLHGLSKLASAPGGHFPTRGEGWVEKLNLFRLWQMGSHSKGMTVQNSIFLVSSCQCQTLIKYLVLIALNWIFQNSL